MKFDYKKFLNKLGYNARCEKCKHVQYHRGRFLSDMLLTFTFIIIAYFYFTEEKPYIGAVNNCTAVWNALQSQGLKGIVIPSFNNSSVVQDPNSSFSVP